MIKLIVGLGNPGPQYEATRHNIGFMAIDALPFASSELKWQSQFKGLVATYKSSNGPLFFLKPMTFMNRSGESVAALARFYKIIPTEILVLHDELDIEFGRIILKKGGGLAGHNGLKSMKECLGSDEFCRLRIGISHPGEGVVDYVLSRFSGDDKKNLPLLLAKIGEVLELLMREGYEKAVALYNRKNLIKES